MSLPRWWLSNNSPPYKPPFHLLLLIGFIYGFILSYIIHYLPWEEENHKQIDSKDKKYSKKLILIWNLNQYHIHHWITFSLICVFLLIGRYASKPVLNLLLGLSLGTILEDFLFDTIFDFNVKYLNLIM
jgi:hypothetical protein